MDPIIAALIVGHILDDLLIIALSRKLAGRINSHRPVPRPVRPASSLPLILRPMTIV